MSAKRRWARYVADAVVFIWKCLPWSLNQGLGRLLAFLWGDVFRIRRDVVFENIEKAFPGTSSTTKENWMRRSLQVMSQSFFDVLRIPFLQNSWVDENVVFHGLNHLHHVDGGCLFLTLHMASGDLAAACFSEKVKPLSLISKRFTNEFLDEFWFYLRQQSKTEFIDAHGKNNAFEILKALKRGRGVVFVMDQFMGRPYGIETEFFGHTTGTAYGLSLFAQKTKAPVFPLWTYLGDDSKLNIVVGAQIVMNICETQTVEEKHRVLTNQFNQHLEQIIRQKPEQWMWVHKRWKEFE